MLSLEVHLVTFLKSHILEDNMLSRYGRVSETLAVHGELMSFTTSSSSKRFKERSARMAKQKMNCLLLVHFLIHMLFTSLH